MKNKKLEGPRLKGHLIKLSKQTKILTLDEYKQHRDTSCFMHSIAVAYYSMRLVERLNINCDMESLIVGALLHDYFLYDWHIPSKTHRLHGFTHPKKALYNAKQDWPLNQIEEDIIEKHMFPLTLVPPIYKESLIVCLMDKYCATLEIIKKDPYQRLKDVYAFKR